MANSKRKCRNCGKYGRSDSGHINQNAYYCNSGCFISYAAKNVKSLAEKHKIEKEKSERKRLRKRKNELRPIKFHADRAQRAFNDFIRLRDMGLPCISCDKQDDGSHDRHASHYRSRGACSSLRFDESNVHASCAQCNTHKSGNIEQFTPRLIEKIGEKEFKRIQKAPKAKRWTREDLEEIYRKYKEKAAELKYLIKLGVVA